MAQTQVAVVQHCATTDVATNLDTLEALTRKAAQEGAEVVTWAEAFAYLGAHKGKVPILEALPIGGPILERCQNIAQELKIELLLGGFHEAVPDDERQRPAEDDGLVEHHEQRDQVQALGELPSLHAGGHGFRAGHGRAREPGQRHRRGDV